jgi:hypothetical protein
MKRFGAISGLPAHRVIFQQHHKFYGRNSAGKYPLMCLFGSAKDFRRQARCSDIPTYAEPTRLDRICDSSNLLYLGVSLQQP